MVQPGDSGILGAEVSQDFGFPIGGLNVLRDAAFQPASFDGYEPVL